MKKRGRPPKAKTEKAAKKPTVEIAPELVEQAKPKLPPKLEELSTAITDKMQTVLKEAELSQQVTLLTNAVQLALEPFLERLERTIFLAARVAAADLLRTGQQPETVLTRAIDEGRLAHAILSAQNEVKETQPCPQT